MIQSDASNTAYSVVPLDLGCFPLRGFNLIEASAGTGKTYALANIYLRYLIERNLDVRQILVVTFTEAATQELRDRIRARIQELRLVFEGHGSKDDLLTSLFENSQAPEQDLIRLRLAEREIDQAEICTIHGFCQSLLQSSAWQLGVPLKQDLDEDLSQLKEQAVADFWRGSVMSLSETALKYVRTNWRGPEGLLDGLRVILDRHPAKVLPNKLLDLADWENDLSELAKLLSELQTETVSQIDLVTDLVSQSDLKQLKNKLKWLADIKQWSMNEGSVFESLPKYLFRFRQSLLEEDVKKGGMVPEHDWFNALDQFIERLKVLTARNLHQDAEDVAEFLGFMKQSFLVLSAAKVQSRMALAKEQRGLIGFDDLITQVADALSNDSLRTQAIASVRRDYHCAMIDEFQDTDPAQYHIFSSLFVGSSGPNSGSDLPAEKSDEPNTDLVLIGDPKQAIYSFRGGDMETYLQAKRDVASHPCGQLFGMDTNWRSSPQMVGAVNQVFMETPEPFMSGEIPFIEVKAAKKATDANWGSALRIQTMPAVNAETSKPYSKAELDERMANAVAAQVSKLLVDEAPVLGISSSDIAILVRTSAQASLMQQALSLQGVRASFEGKESVFSSEEAFSFLLMLRMIWEPRNLSFIRQCLADSLMGMSDQELYSEFNDSYRLAALQQKLSSLRDLWIQKGVLALLRQFVDRFDLLARWRVQVSSSNHSQALERKLSNLTQLAEILQSEARLRPEPSNLLQWYETILQDDRAVNDQTRLRLESDEHLVQIVTIHKSKGLEYPIVFLPFMYSAKGASDAWFYEGGKRCLDLLKSEQHKQEAEQARLAEDIRLLYVALTRSEKRCYVGLVNYKSNSPQSLGLHRTALGSLLWGKDGVPTKALDDQAFSDRLAQIQNGVLSVSEIPMASPTRAKNENVADSELKQSYGHRAFLRELNKHWRVQSFSGILHEHHLHHERGRDLKKARELVPLSTRKEPSTQGYSIFNFPKGSDAGTFLHELFESVYLENGELLDSIRDRVYSDLLRELDKPHEGEDLSDKRLLIQHISNALEKSKLVPELEREDWAVFLQTWLQSALDFPIPIAHEAGLHIRLSALHSESYLSEMEFHFSVDMLNPIFLNRILKTHGLSQETIDFQAFQGHLKGAIDLVFEYQGRFYVLDYKSNYLGDEVADYHRDALSEAMADHRYDLQYLIYTLALHRHLNHRLGDSYSYQEHFGGVIYLFLRGLNFDASTESYGVYDCLPEQALIEELDQLLLSAESG